MWKLKSDWGWCLGGAYFLAKFQAGGAYRGGAYKKACIVAHLTLSFYLYKSNCNISKFGQNLALNAFSSRDILC